MVKLTRKIYRFIGVIVLSLVFLASQTIAGISLPSASAASASDIQKCFDTYNGKDVVVSRLSIAEQTFYNTTCIGESICIDAGEGTEIGSRRIICTSPNSLTEEQKRKLDDLETAPLVKLYCGDAPVGEAAQTVYLACATKVRNAYFNDCNSTGGGITSEMQTTTQQAATCMAGKDLGTKVPTATIFTAIQAGRDARATGLAETIKEIQTNNAKSDCEARIKKGEAVEWVNESCVAKTTTATETTCVGGGLGYLLCPAVAVLKDLNDRMTPFIEDLLIVKTTTNDTAATSIQAIWRILVTIANLVLVVAFLIVIFSQATSFGLDAYGIKRMLPRIIAAAILINLSYFICSVCIDISNVVGSSVRDIIQTGINAVPQPANATFTLNAGTTVGAWLTVLVGALAAGTVLAITGTIAFILPVLFLGTMATLGMFMGIAIRQVVIIMFIIISPLALAAMILPNTEPLFKKWLSSFIKLLALYPIIMALIYTSALISKIILSTGGL